MSWLYYFIFMRLSCFLIFEELIGGVRVCVRGGSVNRVNGDFFCLSFGGFKIRREVKLFVLWWFVIYFMVGNIIFAIKYGRFVS